VAKPVTTPVGQLYLSFFTTAPPKPSVQTKFILEAMSTNTNDEKSRWEQVMDNFDLVFKQMNDISLIQQQLKQSVDDTKAEQKLISKQVQANGQAVASLTLRQMENEAAMHQSENVSLSSAEEAHFDNIFASKDYVVKTEPSNRQQHHHKDSTPHHALPKMQFPTFDGNHPKIWLDNCDNYFKIYKTEDEMKVTYATMHL